MNQLTTANHNGRSYTYKYNADGLRTQKSVDGTTTYYIYSGDKLVAQKTGNNTIYLEYDSTGSPFLISYNGSHYYYILNGQGDVIALIDNTGNTVVEYTYDPWGQITSITGALAGTLGQANPLRYRGYYYDSETGLYYLQSRYYDPETGRFISADGLLSTGQGVLGYNMFAYCGNNPVNRIDSNGYAWEWIKNIFKTIVSLFTKSAKGDTKINKEDSVVSTVKMSTVQEEVVAESYIAAENMINYYNTDKTYVHKSHNEKRLNDLIAPDTKWGRKAYSTFNAFLNNGGTYIIYEEYKVDMNIQGLAWDELSVQQQDIIAENYLAWSQPSIFFMGVFYGIDAVNDVAEKAFLSRLG